MSTMTARRGERYGIDVDLIVWECPVCGIVYGVPKSFADACRRSGKRYHCPNGDSLGWNETEVDRQRKRAEMAERRAEGAESTARYQRERAEQLDRSRAALKGQVTKMKNRIAQGVCPVPGCKRSGFTNVMRHVASKHPAWHHEHAHDLAVRDERSTSE